MTVAVVVVAMVLGIGPRPPASEAVRPCVFVQVQTYWVRWCSPIEFSAMTCYTYTGTNPNPPLYVKAEACYPTRVP